MFRGLGGWLGAGHALVRSVKVYRTIFIAILGRAAKRAAVKMSFFFSPPSWAGCVFCLGEALSWFDTAEWPAYVPWFGGAWLGSGHHLYSI